MAEFKKEKLQARPWHFSLDHFNSLLLVVFPFLMFTCLFGDLVVTATHSACFVRQVDICLLAYVSMDYPQQRAWHRWNACKCLLGEIKQPAIRQADLPICSAESRQLGRTWREMNMWRSLPRGITQAWWRRGMHSSLPVDVLKLQKPIKCAQPEQRTGNFLAPSSSLPGKMGWWCFGDGFFEWWFYLFLRVKEVDSEPCFGSYSFPHLQLVGLCLKVSL